MRWPSCPQKPSQFYSSTILQSIFQLILPLHESHLSLGQVTVSTEGYPKIVVFKKNNHTEKCAFHCITTAQMAFVFLRGNQSVVKDTGCFAQGNILCLQGTVSNPSQSMKFITHKQADNEMKSIHLKPKTRCFHGMLSAWFTCSCQSLYDGRKRVCVSACIYLD